MIVTRTPTAGPRICLGLIFFCLQLGFMPSLSEGYNQSQYQKFQKNILDYRSRLNPDFKKVRRQRTRYIIVHTAELGLEATLRVVSRGKQFKSGYKTPGGHAHYVIARNGVTYRILDKEYRADHAGRSMWSGQENISDVSVGIELAGYHYAPITASQYTSLGILLASLKKDYNLDDRDVLTHSQVAYGKPNPWFKKNHRGRKRCAKNFDRSQAGLGQTWKYDPDVRSGRLMADPELARVFYSPSSLAATRVLGSTSLPETPVPASPSLAETRVLGSNIISATNSAWSISGEDYDSQTTVYLLPDGRTIPGNRITKTIGWNRLPMNTKVLLNQDANPAVVQRQVQTPIKTISESMTAWSYAGPAFREDTTIYFLPTGRVFPGSKIVDWDDLPQKTRLLVGYKGPFPITSDQTAYKIAGTRYKSSETIYSLSFGQLKTGDQIADFGDLPRGTQIYLPVSMKKNQ